ncbi:MAG: L-threonylcarbamoyladenylate synthase [bacterium]|nr:L-threonylcarbamoyladenylate synthase [bacterium]
MTGAACADHCAVRRIPADPDRDAALRDAASVLDAGGLLAYPTETVYGIGADPENARAVDRVRELKGGSPDRAVLLVADSEGAIRPWITDIPEPARRLMRRFWPGPLTLVFRASDRLPPAMRNDRGTVAFRISPDPVCAGLARFFGRPVVSTSANPAGREPARSAEEVLGYFKAGLDAVLDGGARPGSAPSTLVDVTGPVPLLLRRGPVPAEAIRSEIGRLNERETL